MFVKFAGLEVRARCGVLDWVEGDGDGDGDGW